MPQREDIGVRERIRQGKNARVCPVAKEGGYSPSTLYAWIAAGKVRAVRVGRTITIPPDEAARLLGMAA